MLVNLTDYYKNREKSGCVRLEYSKDVFDDGITSYPVTDNGGFDLNISLVSKSEVRINGQGSIKIKMPCDRCLKDVDVEIPVNIDYAIIEPGEGVEDDPDTDEFVDGYELDTDKLIHYELIMGLPMKVLCKDDCKGLCAVCGRDRNTYDCGCDTFVPDPRMAAIQDIFNANNKEV